MCIKIGGWVRQQIGYGINGNLTNGAYGRPTSTPAQRKTSRCVAAVTSPRMLATRPNTARFAATSRSVSRRAGRPTRRPVPTSRPAPPGWSANRALHPVGRLHLRSVAVVLRLLLRPGDVVLRRQHQPVGRHRRRRQGCDGVHRAVRQRPLGHVVHRRSAQCRRDTRPPAAGFRPRPRVRLRRQRGEEYPDVVANLRVDQPWGAAQIMGALHDASGQYVTGANNNGSPSATDTVGWAVGAGIKLFAPMIGQGDYLQAEVNYTEGAEGYINAVAGMFSKYNGGVGGSYGFGISSDNVIDATGGNHLTTAWGVNAAYEHFWNKHWQTSIYGGYSATKLRRRCQRDVVHSRGSVMAPAVATTTGRSGTSVPAPSGTSTRRPPWVSTSCTSISTLQTRGAVDCCGRERLRSWAALAPSPTRALGWVSSASIVTSIPDRLIKVKFARQRAPGGKLPGFFFFTTTD